MNMKPEDYPDAWDDACCSICLHAPSFQRPAKPYMQDPCHCRCHEIAAKRRKLIIVAERRVKAARLLETGKICGAHFWGDWHPCMRPKGIKHECEFVDPWSPTAEEYEEAEKEMRCKLNIDNALIAVCEGIGFLKEGRYPL